MKSGGKINLTNRRGKVAIPPTKLRQAAGKILQNLGYAGYEVSIVLVDDREITRLNRQYFHRNRPTNVISFPMDLTAPAGLPFKVLGDVVISVEAARRQAEEAGRSVEEEILFLLTHGLLHLVGYDHEAAPEERRKMEAKEEELFSAALSLWSKGRKKTCHFPLGSFKITRPGRIGAGRKKRGMDKLIHP